MQVLHFLTQIVPHFKNFGIQVFIYLFFKLRWYLFLCILLIYFHWDFHVPDRLLHFGRQFHRRGLFFVYH